jgi:hypothetical protein
MDKTRKASADNVKVLAAAYANACVTGFELNEARMTLHAAIDALALLAQQPEAVGAETAPQGQAGADAVDAKRYRWLRENCLDWEVDGEHRWGALHFDNSSGREGIFADAPESLDAAIDALLPQPPKDQEA